MLPSHVSLGWQPNGATPLYPDSTQAKRTETGIRLRVVESENDLKKI